MSDPMDIVVVKPAKTFEEQLSILKSRGLIVEDEGWALDVLQRISYYRLTGYLIEYKLNEYNYKPGTSFRLIYETYQFDASMRNLLIAVLETVEISIRTKLSYFMSHTFGPLGYEESVNFYDQKRHCEHCNKLHEEIARSGELFADHYREKYGGRYPIWVASEMMSFGTLSKYFSNMHRRHKNAFSKLYFNVDESLLRSWLICLVNVRNVCAHFARLYDRQLRLPPKIHRDDVPLVPRSNTMFAALMVARRLCEPQTDWLNFVMSLRKLVDQYDDYIEINKLGFPEDWESSLSAV